MKCHIRFSRKTKKKYFNMLSAEIFTQHAKRQIHQHTDVHNIKMWVTYDENHDKAISLPDVTLSPVFASPLLSQIIFSWFVSTLLSEIHMCPEPANN